MNLFSRALSRPPILLALLLAAAAARAGSPAAAYRGADPQLLTQVRENFEAAARGRHQMDLETMSGEWVDARSIARRALVMLDGGTLARDYALLMR